MQELRSRLEGLGFVQPTSIVHQDNQSTITLATNGVGRAAKEKHLARRLATIKEALVNKELRLKWQPTEDMVADGLTKVLGPGDFFKFRDKLGVVDVVQARIDGILGRRSVDGGV